MNSAATNNNVTALSSTPKPQISKEVIQANVQLLIEQLEAGHSEALTNYLTAMGRFHNYSLGNILEIARQMPAAGRSRCARRTVDSQARWSRPWRGLRLRGRHRQWRE